MNVWLLVADEFHNDQGASVVGVFASLALAETAFAEFLAYEEDFARAFAAEHGGPVEAKRVVNEEDLSVGEHTTIVRWVGVQGDDEFETDTWTLEERPIQGL